MACWNNLVEGDILEKCVICLANVKKARKEVHLIKCWEQKNEAIDVLDLMRCPLSQLHVIPRKFLNHHLDGNCDEAQNELRKFFQDSEKRKILESMQPPVHFLQEIPEETLNNRNKALLYVLQKDLTGKSLSGDKELYPDGWSRT